MIDTLRKGRKICGVQMRMLKSQEKETGSWLQVSSVLQENGCLQPRTEQNETKQMRHRRKLFRESRIRRELKVFGVFRNFWDVYEKTDTRWDLCKDVAKKTLEQIVGTNSKIMEKEWFDKDCRKTAEIDI